MIAAKQGQQGHRPEAADDPLILIPHFFTLI